MNADINNIAEKFEIDGPTMQACLDEAKLTTGELQENMVL